MNENSLSDEICIRHLAFESKSQKRMIDQLFAGYNDLNKRIVALETRDHGLMEIIRTVNAGLIAVTDRVRALEAPPTVGNAYTTAEGWEAKQKAVEARCVSKWRDAKTDPPERSGTYLVAGYNIGVWISWIGFYQSANITDKWTMYNPEQSVARPWCITHWQELPESPKLPEPS